MLFDELYNTEVFKRGHLVSLSGVNESTLKFYLPLLHKASRRVTVERKASRFTGVEAMAVMIMAELQREWGMRPEFSFLTAWLVSVNFCREFDGALKGSDLHAVFPGKTFTFAFSPEVGGKGKCGTLPDEFALDVDYQYQPGLFSFVGMKDEIIRERIFEPMMDLRETVTGVDLFWKAVMEARRDDAQTTPGT